jgi:diamine N-acetyltransferase
VEYLLKTFYSADALADVMNNGQQEFILLYDEGSPKGFASFGARGDGVFKLYKLYVLPATHGNGYGRALVEEVKRRVKQRADEKKPCVLDLNVFRGNPALKFYEKLGFTIIGEVNEPVGKFFFEDYVMRIEL